MGDLPILKYKDEIKNALKKHDLIIIKGETGCGKTTQIPQIINEIYFERDKKKDEKGNEKTNKKKNKKGMLISLPRRVATITVAERVAKEMNKGNVGKYVGYSIRFKNVCSDKTKIKFVTDGILIREIMFDPLLKKYRFLILDEVHERSIRTDVLLGYSKILLKKRKKLKIILMSATFDIQTFNNFFNDPCIISVPHKPHKITVYYPKKSVEDYLLSVVCTILQIHFGNAYIKKEGEDDFHPDFELSSMLEDKKKETENGKEEKNKEGKGGKKKKKKKIIENDNVVTEIDAEHELKKKKLEKLGDILVFLPGQEEIEMVNAMLKEKLKIIYKGKLLSKLVHENVKTESEKEKERKEKEKEDVLETVKDVFSAENQDPIIKDICFHFGKTEIMPEKIYTLKVFQLYSSLPHKKQRIIFEPVPPNTRKVILSTNIAETSVTIPNIRYVIDSGKAKVKYFDVKKGSSVLRLTQISKDSAIQRSGRAGRNAPGKVFRIYTEEEYNKMPPFLIPEIFRSDLTQIYLELKAMNIENPLHFEFPENPKKELFIHSAQMLYRLNAIDSNNKLTELGKKMCYFPLSPIYANMCLCSIEFNCVDEIATIVAILNCDSIFLNFNFYEELNFMNEQMRQDVKRKTKVNKELEKRDNKMKYKEKGNVEKQGHGQGHGQETKQEKSALGSASESEKEIDAKELKITDKSKLINIARRKLIHPDGDHLTLLHIFYLWKESSITEKRNICSMYALNNEVLNQVDRIKNQLLDIMQKKLKVDVTRKLHMHNWENVLICLCKSCFFNIAKLTMNSNLYVNLVSKAKIRIHPSSTLFNALIKPSFIFYTDVVQTTKMYARVVTKIEGEWLLKHVSQKFKLKKE